MLKGIPDLISPDLLTILAEMGHGDSIVVADTFYPSKSKSHDGKVVYAKGVGAVEIIDSILKIMPVDSEMSNNPIQYMVADDDEPFEVIHEDVLEIIEKNGYSKDIYHPLKRSDFYELAKNSFATISTGEQRPYGCFILHKGIK